MFIWRASPESEVSARGDRCWCLDWGCGSSGKSRDERASGRGEVRVDVWAVLVEVFVGCWLWGGEFLSKLDSYLGLD